MKFNQRAVHGISGVCPGSRSASLAGSQRQRGDKRKDGSPTDRLSGLLQAKCHLDVIIFVDRAWGVDATTGVSIPIAASATVTMSLADKPASAHCFGWES